MQNTSKTIVFFGSGPVAAASLASLSQYFDIEVVITKAVPPHHKGTAPVEELSRKLNLPILFASTKKELNDIFASQSFNSRLGVVVDYGVIISEQVINSFKLGILNSHFSLLPEWRGADPITFSILSGQKTTGVSLMIIDSGLDTGKLIAQQELSISSDSTTRSLTDELVALSNQMLANYIPKYMDDQITLYDQPNTIAPTYSRKLTKADGDIDATKPAAQIECEIRAYLGWPGSRMKFKDRTLIIKKARVDSAPNSQLDILCSDGKYLIIDQLLAPSGRTVSARDFLNGYA